jgi:hypothetical protein
MTARIHPIADFFSIESDIDLVLLDTDGNDGDGDVRIRQGKVQLDDATKIGGTTHYQYYENGSRQSVIDDRGDDRRAEIRQGRKRIEITVTPGYAQLNSKMVSFQGAGFTKLLLSVIQYRLLQDNATIAYGAAGESADGTGFLLFAGSGSGKSTTLFRLATEHEFSVVADDLVIIHQEDVYPFPRYMDLPLNVPSISPDVEQLRHKYSSDIQEWPDEVSVPRRFISTVPSSITPEYSFFVGPSRIPIRNASKLSGDEVKEMAVALNRSYASSWTAYEPVRHFFDRYAHREFSDDRDTLLRKAVAGTSSHTITASTPDRVPTIIVNTLGSS